MIRDLKKYDFARAYRIMSWVYGIPRVYGIMSCFDKTANGWLHKGIMIQGHKIQVVLS